MRIAVSLAMVILAALALGACNSTDHSAKTVSKTLPTTVKPEANHADTGRRISVSEVQDLVAKGQAFILDVRNQAAFDSEHIRGAKLIPLSEVSTRSDELPRDKTIVTYCACPAEQTSGAAVVALNTKGIENVAALVGGIKAWKEAGLAVDSKQ